MGLVKFEWIDVHQTGFEYFPDPKLISLDDEVDYSNSNKFVAWFAMTIVGGKRKPRNFIPHLCRVATNRK